MHLSWIIRYFANLLKSLSDFSTKSLHDMVSRKWLNMNKIANFSSITSILISLSSHNLRKDGHLSKPFDSKEENTMRTPLSRDDNTRRHGQEFPRNRLQLQVCSSKNFG